MNIQAYHRQQRAMAKAQADFDNQSPPDDEEESDPEFIEYMKELEVERIIEAKEDKERGDDWK
ncbi:MAG: hypothetical protein J0665_01045 [Deltaproteobacteria bacterium]|nr:hypothetical protein [Deltaproteobacteria bacterium]